MNRKYGALTSSQDPEQIANKVKGVILLFSSAIIFLASRLLGVTLTANDIVSLATEIGGISGAVWAIYGSILHLIAWFYKTRA